MSGRAAKSRVAAPSMVLIPAELASITIVRAALREALADHHWCPDDTQRVVLATSEATANAVEHGSVPGELVEIVHHVGTVEATVRILDSGGPAPWEPMIPPAEPVDAFAARGRGLMLIHALAQSVEIRPAGHGTEIRMDFTRTG